MFKPIAWTAPSLVRIAENVREPGNETKIEICAAKGESESFQIAVTAHEQRLDDVSIAAEDFRTTDGQTIGRSNIALYREHYVTVTEARASKPVAGTPVANPPLGAGYYADALIPLSAGETFYVVPPLTQPVWIDVNVPRQAAAGRYEAKFTVSYKIGGVPGSATVAVTLIVWNFVLPLRPALQSAFLVRDMTKMSYQRPEGELGVELLKHRLMPRLTFNAEQECAFINDYGLNISSVMRELGEPPEVGEPPSAEAFKKAAAEHKCRVPLYCYVVDEIAEKPWLFPKVHQWAANMHPAGIDSLVTVPPHSDLHDSVDIWVVLPRQYDANKCREVQDKGNQVWSYNALVQDNDSPKWHIDFEPINFRVQPGFINQSLGLTGLLYWGVNYWYGDPWKRLGYLGPGDGMLFYPETVQPYRTFPSMRLKWIRDGVRDFDYVALLKAAGHGAWALQLCREIAPDWRTWTREPAVLESVRRKIRPGAQ